MCLNHRKIRRLQLPAVPPRTDRSAVLVTRHSRLVCRGVIHFFVRSVRAELIMLPRVNSRPSQIQPTKLCCTAHSGGANSTITSFNFMHIAVAPIVAARRSSRNMMGRGGCPTGNATMAMAGGA